MKKTKVINIFGGPGITKSTTATGVFSLLKMHEIDCEYVPEFAKDLVWEERAKSLQNQIYIFSKQFHRLWRVVGSVDVVVTDSPLLLALIYSHISKGENFKATVKEEFNKLDNMNFLLKRKKAYNPNGRYQNEGEAKTLDISIEKMLNDNNIDYMTCDGNHNAVNFISRQVLSLFGKEQLFKIEKIVKSRIV